MSTVIASNLDEPPPKTNQPPSMFSSLPNDIVIEILARVPKRSYPILSCVSNKFQILVHSREIQKTRSLLDKDSLYLSFKDYTGCTRTRNWFTLRGMEKNPTNNLFVSINVPLNPFNPKYSSIIAVGPEIFCFGGSFGVRSSSLWIFDSRSGKSRRGPNMQVEPEYTSTVGLVGGKIYVIGCDKHSKIHAEFFDLKTQTWNPAPFPKKGRCTCTWMFMENSVVLGGKVCALNSSHITCYDTRDGSRERLEYADYGRWCDGRECVIDNVLYIYYNKLGLMWYDSKLRQWRLVNGLDHLENNRIIGMAEYYGKLAYIWIEWHNVVCSETKEIWCRMIALDKSEEGIHGTAEPSQLLGTVPRFYSLEKCLSLSG